MRVISKKQAIQEKLKFYFTGKPCKRGHMAERRVCDRQCVECQKEYQKEYHKTEAYKEYQKSDNVKAIRDRHYQENKEQIQKRNKKYVQEHQEEMTSYYHSFREKNKEKIKERKHAYYLANRDKILEKMGSYYESNREVAIQRVSKHQRVYKNKRYQEDSEYRIRDNLRCRLGDAFRQQRIKKSEKTFDLTSCTFRKLIEHLESKFLPGMSIENYGKWQIDHIIPCASFDLKCPLQQKLCFGFWNLQPLWVEDHKEKTKTDLCNMRMLANG